MRNRMSINMKMIIMAVLIAMIGVAIGIIGIVNMRTLSSMLADMYNDDLVGVVYAEEIYKGVADIRIRVLEQIIEPTSERKDALAKELATYEQTFATNIADCKKGTSNAESLQDLGEIEGIFASFKASYTQALSRTLTTNEAVEWLNTKTIPIYDNEMRPLLKELVADFKNSAKAQDEAGDELSSSSQLLIIISLFVGFIASLIAAILISRSISKPVTESIRTLAEGASQLKISADQMTINAGQLTASAGQLSSASQEIATGAAEQASSIEETTSSMEELASMVRQNMENAKEASILASKSSEASVQGAEQMEKMLLSMQEIAKSADEIQNVVDVIEDIAFQTNMLALNAAVEAARAGEAGMGFAVVADEVKNLANRSAENAKESGKMIKVAVSRTQEGLTAAQKLSELFKDILAGSRKVNEMTKEIESASRQQDEGITQVNKAIIQFDTVVQSNAANSEETASAAEETASTADQTASSSEELQSQVEITNQVVQDLALIITGKAAEVTTEHPLKASLQPRGAPKLLPPTRRPVPALSHSSHNPAAEPGTHAVKVTAPASGPATPKANGFNLDFEDDEEFVEK